MAASGQDTGKCLRAYWGMPGRATGSVRVGLYASSAVHDALWEETLVVVVGLGHRCGVCPGRCAEVGQSQFWGVGAGRNALGAAWEASGSFVQGSGKATKCGPPSDDQKMGRLRALQAIPCVCSGVSVFGAPIQGPQFSGGKAVWGVVFLGPRVGAGARLFVGECRAWMSCLVALQASEEAAGRRRVGPEARPQLFCDRPAASSPTAEFETKSPHRSLGRKPRRLLVSGWASSDLKTLVLVVCWHVGHPR